MASLTPASSPSRTRPSIVMRSPRDSEVASDACPERISAGLKKGPTVCDGVCSRLISGNRGSGIPAAQHKVESVSERIFGNSNFDIESCYQPLASMVGHAVEDRIESQKRISRKVHLGDEAR